MVERRVKTRTGEYGMEEVLQDLSKVALDDNDRMITFLGILRKKLRRLSGSKRKLN
jgi:hypothetical protein